MRRRTVDHGLGPALTDFWVRRQFKHLRSAYFKVSPLHQLSIAAQLQFSILREDRPTCMNILSAPLSGATIEQFLECARVSQIAGLCMQQMIEMDLYPGLCKENTQILQELSALAAHEFAVNEKMELQFIELLDLLSQWTDDLIWIKGTALSRTFYEKSEHRNSSDFDVIVRADALPAVAARLCEASFVPALGAASCDQSGVGPRQSASDLLLAPDGFEPSAVMCFRRAGLPYVDIKCGAFDRGIRMVEQDRFWKDARPVVVRGRRFLVPDDLDHLMTCLRNAEKDRFTNTKASLDVHTIIMHLVQGAGPGGNAKDIDGQALEQLPLFWSELIRRARIEGLSASAWSILWLVRDRFNSPVPATVLLHLAPSDSIVARTLLFTVSKTFGWNQTSLPMMLLDLCVASDRKRKFSILISSFLPSKRFLQAYYKVNVSWLLLPFVLAIHWLILVLPAGIVRRSFGPLIWRTCAETFVTPKMATEQSRGLIVVPK